MRERARGRRSLFAIIGNGAVSVASLALSVAVARATTSSEFGAFALALLVYVFASGIARAAFTDTALAQPSDPETLERSFRRACLSSLAGASGVLIWGLLTANVHLLIVAIALHGLMTLDFVRTVDSAVGSETRALVLSAAWTTATLATSIASFFVPVGPTVLLAIWAAAGALCGYFALIVRRLPWRPGWPRNTTETAAARVFALDYIVGSGGSVLTTTLLGVAVQPMVIGAIRGAGTLVGPANLIASTARSLIIPVLARAKPSAEFGAAARVSLWLAAVLTPLLFALTLLPSTWGTWLLGDTWELARVALPALALESLLAVVGGIAAAGHRAAFAGRRTLMLRLVVGIPRPVIVILCAVVWGVAGAAWSMAAIAAVNALIWWVSYAQLTRRAATPE